MRASPGPSSRPSVKTRARTPVPTRVCEEGQVAPHALTAETKHHFSERGLDSASAPCFVTLAMRGVHRHRGHGEEEATAQGRDPQGVAGPPVPEQLQVSRGAQLPTLPRGPGPRPRPVWLSGPGRGGAGRGESYCPRLLDGGPGRHSTPDRVQDSPPTKAVPAPNARGAVTEECGGKAHVGPTGTDATGRDGKGPHVNAGA